MYNSGPVIVMQLSEQLTQTEVSSFLAELAPLLQNDRPRVVLECSEVRQLDSAGVEMLLHCTEEAMKRDGDLKLAALSPACATILELTRVDRLFEIFETAEAAIQSFHAFPSSAVPESEPWYAASYGPIGDFKAAG
ncbi:MAG TPA: STAS domain-containing protein [Candidatus Sulfotelmatobacter sp.]|nr:STAS domain-containing protein [Candidatus Sulfotelmatobacter sp.]